MAKPYSNCDIENDYSAYLSEVFLKSDLYKIIWHSPLDYSQQLCLDVCLQRRIGQACNCTPLDKYSLLPQYAPCNPSKKFLVFFLQVSHHFPSISTLISSNSMCFSRDFAWKVPEILRGIKTLWHEILDGFWGFFRTF